MNSTLPHALQSNFPSVKSYGLTNMMFTSRSKPLLRQLNPCLMTFLVWVKEYVQILSNVTGAISEVKLLLYILEKTDILKLQHTFIDQTCTIMFMLAVERKVNASINHNITMVKKKYLQ
jgi:hypothetical protein